MRPYTKDRRIGTLAMMHKENIKSRKMKRFTDAVWAGLA